MDGVRGFFNILLLSISLATVIVTLIAYILFRLRYSFTRNEKKDLHTLEGTFFKRYAPHLHQENEAAKSEIVKQQKERMSPQKKMMVVFGSCFLLILTVLSAENYFNFRKAVASRSRNAESLRNLINKGLLKRYQFDPQKSSVSLRESPSPYLEQQRINLLQNLREERIILVKDNLRFLDENFTAHAKAFKGWEKLLRKLNLKFEVRGLEQVDEKALVIMPSLAVLSLKERARVEKLLEKGRVIATGYPGRFVDKERPSKSLLEEMGLLQFERKEKAETYHPTQLLGVRDLPAGLVLDLFPHDNSFYPVGKFEDWELFSRTSGYFTDEPNAEKYPRSLSHKELSLVWSEVDPALTSSEENFEKNWYSEFYFLSLLNAPLRNNKAHISSWKKAERDSVVALTIDTEEKFSNIKKFLGLFEKEEIPASFFIVSDFLRENDIDLNNYSRVEFGSHTTDHRPLIDRETAETFIEISNSRLDIEERSQRPVVGIRPPEEKLDGRSLASVVQNKLKYIFGPKISPRFAPYLLGDEEPIVFIPRTLRDDINLAEDRLLVSSSDMGRELIRDLNWIVDAQGGYFLSLHTHVFGEDLFFPAVKILLDEAKKKANLWITSMEAIANWKQDQANLQILHSPNELVFRIKNSGGTTIENFDVEIDSIKCPQRKIATVEVLKPGEIKDFPYCI